MTPAEQRAAELQRCRESGHRCDWLPWPFDLCPVGTKVLRPYIEPALDWADAYEPMLVLGAEEREFDEVGSRCDHCGHVVRERRNPMYGWWRMRTLDPAQAAKRVVGSDKLLGEHDLLVYPPELVRAVECVDCRGTGAVDDVDNEDTCSSCHGAGLVPAPRPMLPAITVKLPLGVMVVRNQSTDRRLYLHCEEVFDEATSLVLAAGHVAMDVANSDALYATWAAAPVDAHPTRCIWLIYGVTATDRHECCL